MSPSLSRCAASPANQDVRPMAQNEEAHEEVPSEAVHHGHTQQAELPKRE
jgi:hypothetical protein